MVITKKMRFSKCSEVHSEKGNFFIADFLDEEDDKYSFFVNEEYYKSLKDLKKYDTININLVLRNSRNGRYSLSLS